MNPNSPDHDPALGRVDALHRQQLSALIDGELSADQARFLIRRLEHDLDLSACQERWQMAGDVLRGQLGAVAPADFAARVALALPPSTALVRSGVRPWYQRPRGWTGGALAAGLAMLAVLWLPATRQPEPAPAVQLAGAQLHQPDVAPAEPAAAGLAGPVVPAAALPVQETAPTQAVAVARPRAAAPHRQRALPAAVVTAEAAPALLASDDHTAPPSPFALPAAGSQPRPWPRSQLARPDTLSVDLPAAGSPFAPPRGTAADSWAAPQP